MGATQIEFRFRLPIIVIIICLGFWSPWIQLLEIGSRLPLLEWLTLELARLGLVSFATATPVVIVLGTLIAAKGVLFRVWGTAYLGAATVNHGQMRASQVVADGPYRYLRNPLYIGSWCMFAAMSLSMPVTGALFAMVLLTIFLFRLILGEEAYLTDQLGEVYQDYLQSVPRLIPHLRTTLPPTQASPHWGHALLAELNSIGVLLVMGVVAWSYNNDWMVKGIIISFGVSLVVRALMPELGQDV